MYTCFAAILYCASEASYTIVIDPKFTDIDKKVRKICFFGDNVGII